VEHALICIFACKMGVFMQGLDFAVAAP